MLDNKQGEIIKKLFEDAQKNGMLNYIFCLLRVGSIENEIEDIFVTINQLSKKFNKAEYGKLYNLITLEKSLELFVNLIRGKKDQRYDPHPFRSLYKLDGQQYKRPDRFDMLNFLINIYKEENLTLFCDFFNSLKRETSSDSDNKLNICNFILDFSDTYFEELKKFNQYPKIYNISSGFTTLELLTGGDFGLVGFNLHHSNGSVSTFTRENGKALCLNLDISEEVIPFVGDLGKLQPMWMYNGRPLYEFGVSGRYNKIGEWKPLVYPGESQLIYDKVQEMRNAGVDDKIVSCFFYMMITCHHCIEFIVTGNFSLPDDYSQMNFSSTNKEKEFIMHINKIELPEVDNYSANLKVYDCTMQLPGIDTEDIKDALIAIDTFLARLSFHFSAKYDWLLKYNIVDSDPGMAHIKDNDLIDKFLKNFNTKSSLIADVAIHWYNSAKQTKNVFQKFLSYCISIESILVPYSNNEINLSTVTQERLGSNLINDKLACIRNKFSLYETDPEKFIRESYFECIVGLKKRITQSLKTIFGESDQCYILFCTKSDKLDIYDIRSGLAHGNLKNYEEKDIEIVSKRVGDVEYISRKLIYRILINDQETNDENTYSHLNFSLSRMTNDPRTTGLCTSLSMIPNKDWKIKLDWLL